MEGLTERAEYLPWKAITTHHMLQKFPLHVGSCDTLSGLVSPGLVNL